MRVRYNGLQVSDVRHSGACPCDHLLCSQGLESSLNLAALCMQGACRASRFTPEQQGIPAKIEFNRIRQRCRKVKLMPQDHDVLRL